jgi:hypothetical protein
MTDPLSDQISGLNRSVTQIADNVSELTQKQAGAIARTTRNVHRLAVLMVVVLLVTLLALFNAYSISKIQHQTSSEVLCPGVVRQLRNWNPDGPSAKQDPVGYEKSYRDIEHAAKVLGCSQTKRGLAG